MDIVFKKLGLSKGDKFILKHCINENQNEYADIIFSFDGKEIMPAVNIISLAVGRYVVEKLY